MKKRKKKNVPMLIIDDSQYKDEPINRDPDTSMEISKELQHLHSPKERKSKVPPHILLKILSMRCCLTACILHV